MSEWRQRVREELQREVARTGSALVRRQALLDAAQAWFPRVSSGKTPGQTMSRVLQELRDLGELEFVSPGVYSVLVQSREEAAQREHDLRGPKVRSGERKLRAAMVASRPFQRHFRSYVLPNFGHECAACGLAPEWFLDAAHLRPAGTYPDLAGDPSAGVALCKNHHLALDRGLFVIEADLTISVSKRAIRNPGPELSRTILQMDGQKLRAPRHFDLNPLALPSIGPGLAT